MVLCCYKSCFRLFMPIYLSISFFLPLYGGDLPNNDIRPVPDAKQVMTNINRFQEQV